MNTSTPLDAALAVLRCPVCATAMHRDVHVVRCANEHAFDVARQGYLNLAVGRAHHGTGDSAAMLQARVYVLDTLFAPVVAAVAAAVPVDARRVVDAGGGTGQYLAAAVERAPDALGLCLDLSTAALRRAARAHPHIAAVGVDLWATLPLRDDVADVLLNVFAPRNGPEFARVLGSHGRLVTVTPQPDHLRELREPLGLLDIDPEKDRRQHAAFERFETVDESELRYVVEVDRYDALALARMGPTGKQIADDEWGRRAAALPDRTAVTVAVRLRTLTPS